MSIYESVFGTTLRVHAFIYEHTNGLIGHRMLVVPCLMLRTTGRNTGQTRTNSLVYAKDGERYMVVASKGGRVPEKDNTADLARRPHPRHLTALGRPSLTPPVCKGL